MNSSERLPALMSSQRSLAQPEVRRSCTHVITQAAAARSLSRVRSTVNSATHAQKVGG